MYVGIEAVTMDAEQVGCDSAPAQGMRWDVEILAGALSGAVGICLTHPLDTLRVRMQTFAGQSAHADGASKNLLAENAWKSCQTHSLGLASPRPQACAGHATGSGSTTSSSSNWEMYRSGSANGSNNAAGHRGVAGPKCIPGAQSMCISNALKQWKEGGSMHSSARSQRAAALSRPVLYQVSSAQPSIPRLALERPVQNPYGSVIGGLRTMLQTEGVRGAYRGIAAPLAFAPLLTIFQFASYQAANVGLNSSFMQRLTTVQVSETNKALAAGCFSGFVQCFVSTPSELLKIRVQALERSGGESSFGVWKCLVQTLQTDGFRGLFRGFGINAARRVPAFGIYFFSYEELKTHSVPTFVSGGMAGCAGWIATYPLDVLKSRMQSCPARSTVWEVVRSGLRSEGPRFMYRGLSATLIRSFPFHGTMFCVYELIKKAAL
ncbi:Mitochondrial arginine transporter BAC2 [Porphyridium purpureum]|uniref:Mitochondrial arginine transporter BAC2 n=1 Tax=Porphyridium purpureum TaxID=35688 RepID=A0A5J4YUP6_PORPP|nr:Mitochondrial arginine transporter BAC2 [Porphyridium purpureum]|eukprot:POR8548..scf227_4